VIQAWLLLNERVGEFFPLTKKLPVAGNAVVYPEAARKDISAGTGPQKTPEKPSIKPRIFP
jgi:hypothetical protein